MSHNIGLVMGSFHKKEIEQMRTAAKQAANKSDLNVSQEIWVPGSFEKPLAVKRLLQSKNIEGVAVLGIIERGETKHGLVMGQVVSQALVNLQLEFMKPVGMGILGPEIKPEQILTRLEPYAEAAVKAVKEMLI